MKQLATCAFLINHYVKWTCSLLTNNSTREKQVILFIASYKKRTYSFLTNWETFERKSIPLGDIKSNGNTALQLGLK